MGITVDSQEPTMGSIMETYKALHPFLQALRMSDTWRVPPVPFCHPAAVGLKGFSNPLPSKPSEKLHWNSESLIWKCITVETQVPWLIRCFPFTSFLMNGPPIASLSKHCNSELPQMRGPLHERRSLQWQSSTGSRSCSGPAVKSDERNEFSGVCRAEENTFKVLSRCSCPWRNGFLTAASASLPASV